MSCEGYTRERVFVNSNTGSRFTGGRYILENDISTLSPYELMASANRESFVGGFWRSYLPYGRAFPQRAIELTTGGWTHIAHSMFHTRSLVRSALLGISLCVAGRQHNDPVLLVQGVQQHGRVLRQMREALCPNKQIDRTVLLVTSRILSLFEASC